MSIDLLKFYDATELPSFVAAEGRELNWRLAPQG